METKIVSLSELNSAKYNPRKTLKKGDVAYDALKNSLDKFGYLELIVVNKRNMVIVGGHQRAKILQDNGEEVVEVTMVDLDDESEKALNLSLNKIKGDFNIDELYSELGRLRKEGLLMGEIGFTDDDMDMVEDLHNDDLSITDGDINTDQLDVEVLRFGKYKVVFGKDTYGKFKDKLMTYTATKGVTLNKALIDIIGGK